ncbi:MAG: DUF1015 domain-containing protein [Microscillaceae bacterium]
MAQIKSLRAWRYNAYLTENLPELTAPLSETMRRQKEKAFYQFPFHHFHLSSPSNVPPFENARRRAENWKLDRVIRQDPLPGLYVYAQDFEMGGKTCQRKGFVAHVKLEDYSRKIVFPHERTIPAAVEYRTQLLEATQMHTLPTHGFYRDASARLEPFLEESLRHPIYEVVDQNHTRHRLSVIHDYEVMAFFKNHFADQRIWLADGHHRYESSLRYRQRCLAQFPNASPESPWHYHLMWLTNAETSDLGVLPTHRLVHSLSHFDRRSFLEKLEAYFEISPEAPDAPLPVPIEAPLGTFRLVFADRPFTLRWRPEAQQAYDIDWPESIKNLEVSILQYFILEKTLQLSDEAQFAHLDFTHDFQSCCLDVSRGEAIFAVLTRPVTGTQIEEVCFQGHTMPAKTTYFFPKVLGGLLFSSIREEEFGDF